MAEQKDDPHLPSLTGVLEPVGRVLVLGVVVTKNTFSFVSDERCWEGSSLVEELPETFSTVQYVIRGRK